VETKQIIATLAKNETLSQADGEAKKIIYDAQAAESTIKEVITKQAESYQKMQTTFSSSGAEIILGYLQANLIKDYERGAVMMWLKDENIGTGK